MKICCDPLLHSAAVWRTQTTINGPPNTNTWFFSLTYYNILSLDPRHLHISKVNNIKILAGTFLDQSHFFFYFIPSEIKAKHSLFTDIQSQHALSLEALEHRHNGVVRGRYIIKDVYASPALHSFCKRR